MSDKKIIAVVGATGAQGSGLVRAILNDPKGGFAVRALTRDVNSDKARALGELGAELVQADVNDEASLKRAFDGAYGAFCVTFFWEHMSPEKEIAHAGAMARAAKRAGVGHVIWSSLEDTRRWVPVDDDRMPTLMEKYKVPHFDAKGEADRLFKEQGVPTTILHTSYYWENMIYFGMGPKAGPDGKLAITMPMGNSKLPGIGVEDIGKSAYNIFKKGDQYIGKTVGISGDQLTGEQMAHELADALHQDIVYNNVPPEVFAGFGFPGAEDMANMFQFKRDFESDYCAERDVDRSRELNPELQSFSEWLDRNKDRIPLS